MGRLAPYARWSAVLFLWAAPVACGSVSGDPIVFDEGLTDTGVPPFDTDGQCQIEGFSCETVPCCGGLACVTVDNVSACVDPDLICGGLGDYCSQVIGCCEGLRCQLVPSVGGGICAL